ncbi:MAG: TMAO reductase system periplasmic protein TorT [Pseudorhodoplanes sp.]
MIRSAFLTVVGASAMFAAATANAQSPENWTAKIYKGGQSQTKDVTDYVPLPPKSATKKWHVCVAFPHMKDAYYIARAYGVHEEAKRQGITATILDAGGYTNLPKQISQIEDCVARGGNAVASVAISKVGLLKLIEELDKKGIPVIDMGAGVESPLIKARTSAEWAVAGAATGEYLAKKHPKGSGKAKMVWLAGPPGALWAEEATKGMQAGIANSDVEIVKIAYGDTGKEIQMKLVDDALQTYPDLKIIGGVAPGIEGAVQILREKNKPEIETISYYVTPGIEEGVKAGRIMAMVSDNVVTGARISIDQAVRILEKKELIQNAARQFELVDQSNIKTYDRASILAPAGFTPVFEIK